MWQTQISNWRTPALLEVGFGIRSGSRRTGWTLIGADLAWFGCLDVVLIRSACNRWMLSRAPVLDPLDVRLSLICIAGPITMPALPERKFKRTLWLLAVRLGRWLLSRFKTQLRYRIGR